MTNTFYIIAVKGRNGKDYYLNDLGFFTSTFERAAHFSENDWSKAFNTVLCENLSPITVLKALQSCVNNAKKFEKDRGVAYRLDFSHIYFRKITFSEEQVDSISPKYLEVNYGF